MRGVLYPKGLLCQQNLVTPSNSQYAKAGNAIGETAIGVKKIEAANHVTEESSGSGSSPLTESEMGH